MSHSPEPWKTSRAPFAGYLRIDDSSGREVIDSTTGSEHGCGLDEDARRICAAVNFCQHIPTEVLDTLAKAGVGAATFIQWVRQNPTYQEDMGGCAASASEWRDVCIQCSHIVDHGVHADDCLLNKAIKTIGDAV